MHSSFPMLIQGISFSEGNTTSQGCFTIFWQVTPSFIIFLNNIFITLDIYSKLLVARSGETHDQIFKENHRI